MSDQLGRPRSVSIELPKNGKTWNCKHYTAYGGDKRRNSSLKTRDKNVAEFRRNELERLFDNKVHISDSTNEFIDPLVYKLYYGIDRPFILPSDIDEFRKDSKLLGDAGFLAKYLSRLSYLEAEVERLPGVEKELKDLKNTIEAKRVMAKDVSMYEAIDEFSAYIYQKVAKCTAHDYMRYAKRIQNFYPMKNVVDFEWQDIDNFIETDAKNVAEGKSVNNRKKKARSNISKFFVWASKRYKIPNPVEELDSYKYEETKIIWYDVPQVEEMLETCDSYWAGVLGTMSYTGMGSKEISGIKTIDFLNILDEHFFNVEANEHRGLKTGNRKRKVNIDKVLLLHHIQKFIDDGHCGQELFFAVPENRRNTRKSDKYHSEQWVPAEIGRYANREILAPFGMMVKNLRNTLGSLMLRSDYSVEQVASVLGNTAAVVRANYARLISSEVIMNLKEVKKSPYVIYD